MSLTTLTTTCNVWRWAVWFAVLSGLGQALLIAVARVMADRIIHVSPHVVWTAPAANTVVFAIVAVGLQLSTRWLQRSTVEAVALAVFLFLLLLGPLLIVPRLHPFATITLAAGLAVQGARMLRPRVEALEITVRRTLPWLVGLCVALGLGLHFSRVVAAQRAEAALPAAAPGAPNVVLVVLDTVRAQNLSLYGYSRQTSPRLDAFARSGVVFERALSTSPWTFPSHASFFTGRLPYELSANWLTPLNDKHPTLAETFAAQGYMTVGFTANLLYTTTETGLNRGFVRYSDFPVSVGTLMHDSWLARALTEPLGRLMGRPIRRLVRKNASRVNDEFVAWLASRPQRPFFAFVNYFDAHQPYRPPAPFDKAFGDGGPEPSIQTQRTWSPREIQRSMDAYDGAIAYIDQQLSNMLSILKAEQMLDNTLVVVTSDHGEQFGEHGLFDHANSLYRPLVHVPLVISYPPTVPSGLRVSEPVTLVNLPATILDIVNVTTSDPQFPGRSLAGYWGPTLGPSTPAPPLFAEVSKGINLADFQPASKGPMYSVVVGGMRYIRNGDGREELYDFERDISETNDLAGRPEARASLEEARRALSVMGSQ